MSELVANCVHVIYYTTFPTSYILVEKVSKAGNYVTDVSTEIDLEHQNYLTDRSV